MFTQTRLFSVLADGVKVSSDFGEVERVANCLYHAAYQLGHVDTVRTIIRAAVDTAIMWDGELEEGGVYGDEETPSLMARFASQWDISQRWVKKGSEDDKPSADSSTP